MHVVITCVFCGITCIDRRSRSVRAHRKMLSRRGGAFRARRLLVFAVPAFCDSIATTMINIGLFYT